MSESVSELEYEREYDISKYPQEGAPGGSSGFESFNKVQVPFSAKVTILSNRTRFQLLSILEPIAASLQLVTVVMPEWGYPSANIIRYGFRRTAREGVSLLAVDVWVEEIRYGNSMLTSSASSQQQLQATGGTQRPVGQVSPSTNLAPGSSGLGNGNQAGQFVPIQTLPPQGAHTAVSLTNQDFSGGMASPSSDNQAGQFIPIQDFSGGATNTASTSAAQPTASGPVQPVAPNNAPADWGTVDLTHAPR